MHVPAQTVRNQLPMSFNETCAHSPVSCPFTYIDITFFITVHYLNVSTT